MGATRREKLRIHAELEQAAEQVVLRAACALVDAGRTAVNSLQGARAANARYVELEQAVEGLRELRKSRP